MSTATETKPETRADVERQLAEAEEVVLKLKLRLRKCMKNFYLVVTDRPHSRYIVYASDMRECNDKVTALMNRDFAENPQAVVNVTRTFSSPADARNAIDGSLCVSLHCVCPGDAKEFIADYRAWKLADGPVDKDKPVSSLEHDIKQWERGQKLKQQETR